MTQQIRATLPVPRAFVSCPLKSVVSRVSRLVFHQSNHISASKRMLSYYRHVSIFTYFF